MLTTVMIKRLCADSIQAEQNTIVVGTPSPYSIAGFGEALARMLGGKHLGTAMVVHSFNWQSGHPKFVPYVFKAGAKTKEPPTLELVTADICITLFVKIDVAELQPELLLNAITKIRICGKPLNGIPWFSGDEPISPKWMHGAELALLNDEAALRRAFKNVGFGWLLIDRKDLLEDRDELTDPLDAILDAVAMIKDEDGEWHRKQKGNIVPIHIGFQSIEEASFRNISRRQNERLKHALVESMTSLGQFVSVRRVRAGELPKCFWIPTFDGTTSQYFVAA